MKIKKITKEFYSGPVYNLETEPDHTYFLNNLAVHNCYKNNQPRGQNMPLEIFQQVLKRLPESLQQIAFGIGDINAHPNLFKIFEECRKKEVIPNVTINGYRLEQQHIQELARLCGAVAVSHYDSGIACTRAVRALSVAGLKQKVRVRRKK